MEINDMDRHEDGTLCLDGGEDVTAECHSARLDAERYLWLAVQFATGHQSDIGEWVTGKADLDRYIDEMRKGPGGQQ